MWVPMSHQAMLQPVTEFLNTLMSNIKAVNIGHFKFDFDYEDNGQIFTISNYKKLTKYNSLSADELQMSGFLRNLGESSEDVIGY